MPNFCAAFGCCNNSSKEVCKLQNISFHRFPLKDSLLLSEWLKHLKRENFEPTEHSRLCSEHFHENCFTYQTNNKRVLKSDAIPILFCFQPEKKERPRTSYEFGLDTAPQKLPELLNLEAASQTEDNIITSLLQINEDQDHNIETLTNKLKAASFNVNCIAPEKFQSITGFDYETFNCMYDFLTLEEEEILKRNHAPVKQQFLLFLVKMKSGATDDFLSVTTGISQPSISRYINKLVSILYAKIRAIDIWQTKSHILETMPDVVLIIDSTEFKIQRPSNPSTQQLTFSYYKNCNTLKGLIGIAPSGAIMYISDLWCGSISDKELFKKCHILEKLNPGDDVMADKGFTIKDELEEKKCKLLQPVFMKDKIQFTVEEKTKSSKVSRLRVHVERAIGRVKAFKYFSTLTNQSLHNINEIFYIMCFLSMFQENLIAY